MVSIKAQQPDAAPSCCVGGKSGLRFPAAEPERSPVSLSSATGMFESSGQEVRGGFLCSPACGAASSCSAPRLIYKREGRKDISIGAETLGESNR